MRSELKQEDGKSDSFDSTVQSKILGEELSDERDTKIGKHYNRYHREIIRPATLKLLDFDVALLQLIPTGHQTAKP